MTGVPFTFATATTAIPLSELDVCFATTITIGSTQAGLGNSVPSLDGLGHVNFGGSNLAHYDEGVFTPSLLFGGANVGMTTSATVGFYTRIGDRVFFDLNIQLTARGSSTGAATISGLPIAASNTASRLQTMTIWNSGTAVTTGASVLGIYSGTNITLYQTGLGGAGTTTISQGNMSDSAQFIISGQYGV